MNINMVLRKDAGMGYLCSPFIACLACTILHLVSVVFVTAIPTSLYISKDVFS